MALTLQNLQAFWNLNSRTVGYVRFLPGISMNQAYAGLMPVLCQVNSRFLPGPMNGKIFFQSLSTANASPTGPGSLAARTTPASRSSTTTTAGPTGATAGRPQPGS